ncbi:protein HESO1-like [Papaver somniferum]|uniref:protein HESO1-like n=1 Tax=Papaver somniferum TaxID=3469 RepID=UPI000E7023E7|nr:protein HESO1-like [Papaver somniferum]
MSYFASSSSNHGTNRVLERTLNEILAVIKPSEEDVRARTRIIDDLKAVVNQSAAEYSSLQGVMKSHLLHFVAAIDRRFRDMVLLVKVQEWAKSEDINNARDGTLNSYALCWLVIYHFQTCKPPILPPLKELHTGGTVAGSLIYSVYGDDLINQMNANVERFKRERLINTSSLSELFVSFFQKFSAVEFTNYNYFCTYTETWEETSDTYLAFLDDVPLLHIRDPFARNENVARSVEDTTKIFKAFQKTYAMLLSASGRDRFSLISNFVRPEIGAQMITRG